MEAKLSVTIYLLICLLSGIYPVLNKNLLGEWTVWASWSPCTRSCGIGIRLRQRICITSRSSLVQAECKGLAKDYELCNLDRCPSGSLDFRSLQCSQHASRLHFPLNLYKWVTVSTASQPCNLLCQTQNKLPVEIVELSPIVMDSTPCLGINGICIDNKCVSVGCDNNLDSTLEIDRCGVCGGDGVNCVEVKGRFEKIGLSKGLYSIVKLPVGAGNIRVNKLANNFTDLVVSNPFGGTIFSGLTRSFLPEGEEHQIGSTVVAYMHTKENDPEIVEIKNSQTVRVEILLLVHNDNSHANITYTYMNTSFSQQPTTETHQIQIPGESYQPFEIEFEYDDDGMTIIPINSTSVSNYRSVFTWRTVGPIYCSSTCSLGLTYPYTQCYNNENEVVDDSFCDLALKPKVDPTLCAGRECNARWVASSWGPCSTTCGNGTQQRFVHCWKILAPGFDSTVNKELCEDRERPPQDRVCYSDPCDSHWIVTEWSHCECGLKTRDVRCSKGRCLLHEKPEASRSCDSPTCKWLIGYWTECSGICGTRTREITCQMENITLKARDVCSDEEKPLSREMCSTIRSPCAPNWIPQTWAKCSKKCETFPKLKLDVKKIVCMGWKKSRPIIFRDKRCRYIPKPDLKFFCQHEVCEPKWFFSQWSRCSTSCDAGYRIRQVICLSGNTPSTDCSMFTRPANQEWCNHGPCPR